MNINEKIGKIPFWLLFLTLAALQIIGCFVLFFYVNGKGVNAIQFAQPLDYYLAKQFSGGFGISMQSYFLIAMPFYLIFWFLIIKLGAWFIKLIDEHTQINATNHMITLIILFLLPVTIFQLLHFGFGIFANDFMGMRMAVITSFVLMIVFTIITEVVDHEFRKNIGKV